MPTHSRRNIARTRSGCWTCRSRKKKCDEARPVCQTCRALGLECEGYGVRLKWAGRGKPRVTFNRRIQCNIRRMAFSKPIDSLTSERDRILLKHLGHEIYVTLSEIEKEALYDFCDWGGATLVAKSTPEPPDRFQDTLSCCAQSQPLLLNFITYQITLDPKHAQYVDEYYARSIAQFRETISDPEWYHDESAPWAGLLLATISMHQAMPWTVHVTGIASIFLEQGYFDVPTDESRELAGMIGVLDLPTHTLGRQSKHLYLWHRYCLGMEGIEETTGLPCGLIHLFASAAEPDVEVRLMNWKTETSNPTLQQLWNATRQAGLIMVRDFRREQNMKVLHDPEIDASAVRSILSLVQILRPKMDKEPLVDWGNLLFPLAAAGSQAAHLKPGDHHYIVESINSLANGSLGPRPYYSAIIVALETFWSSKEPRSLQKVTRDLGLELALF